MPTNKTDRKIGRTSDDRQLSHLAVAEERIAAALKSGATRLDLRHLRLTELPESIYHLTQLRSLDISINQLGVLPEALSGLTQLESLDASSNQLSALPEALSKLAELKKLDIATNRLSELPEGLGRLANLQDLDISNNPLNSLPQILTRLAQLRRLIAAGIGLEALPEWLMHLRDLQVLSVSANRLTSLPSSIECLQSLASFCAAANRLPSVPNELCNLRKLEYLALGRNPIPQLPESIGQLSRLQGLELSTDVAVLIWENNRRSWNHGMSAEPGVLRELPNSMRKMGEIRELYLHGQTALGLPPEVIGPSWNDPRRREEQEQAGRPARILDYYFTMRAGRRPLNEAKMILVGRGGVGKTCLINRLVHGVYNPEEKKTDGIAITPWPLRVGADDVRLNIWDFGGQEIMHATHQFFLTKRSLYLLVLNAREGEQDANVEYWLRLIESFGGDSPVLVVINKVADHPFDLNRRGLQSKFPAIRGFVQTDCETKLGLEELRQAVVRETNQLEHLRDPFPASWFKVKDTLTNLPKNEGMNFIPFTRYQQLCSEYGVTETTSQETLVGFLHDLGIVVNFRDNPRLSETQVLDPEWVTNGIYKILNADSLAKREGELRLEHLPNVLDRKEYPKEMHFYLLDLMRKFELCYEFYDGDGHYLVPELLGKEEPDLPEFSAAQALRFEYSYNILPEGLLPRFIVRSRALNKNLPRWRSGVVLEWDGNRAMVKADVQDRRVSITITGPSASRRRLLSVIRADLDHIHQSIPKLQAVEQVPVPWHDGLVVDYSTLCVLDAEGETELKLVQNGRMLKAKITDLLSGVDEICDKPRKSVLEVAAANAARVAFSYSHKDEELRDQLETHLKLLQRQKVISTWHDRRILGGENWSGVIDENFKRADLILLLVSADFLASDYCYQTEMGMALEREAKGEAKVVPVILRACDWKGAPFGKLQGFPKDMKPVTSWPNRDEAWTDVATGIRKVAEQIRARGKQL